VNEPAIAGKFGRRSLLPRLFRHDRAPLRLLAVPRDHVQGDRVRGEQLLLGNFARGTNSLPLADLDFAAVGTAGPLPSELHGFSWLRDLAAASSRDRGAKVAEAVAARWLLAHGTKADAAWRPDLWGERLLFWIAYAPYLLSSHDAAYRAALLNTAARGARHLLSTAEQAMPGLPRITAWAGLNAASLLLEGGTTGVARAESGLARALASAQAADGGLLSRSPSEQVLLVDRLALLRTAYLAAKQQVPDALENAATAALSALGGVVMGDGGLGSWQWGNPGSPARITALVEGCGLRARALRQAGSWGYHRLSALGTTVVVDAAPPPPSKMAPLGCASTLALELSDGPQRLVVNCGGPGMSPADIPVELAALRTTAAHSTLTVGDTNSTAVLADGSLGKGVTDITVSRSDGDDFSRLEAEHDGYVRRFGLGHNRGLALGNDGKELRGLDRLVPRGRKRIRGTAPFTLRFHLGPDVEATRTADRQGAILRSSAAPPWSFRCRGAQLEVEESLWVDGEARLRSTLQLALAGEVVPEGAEVGWQFRRSS
jgi:uncharacterized heparinase superfamily protein